MYIYTYINILITYKRAPAYGGNTLFKKVKEHEIIPFVRGMHRKMY